MKRSLLGVVLVLGLVMALGQVMEASAAVKVRVQPSGPTIPQAYVITGETRTYFGNVEGGASGTYEYRWEFSNGGDTAWADAANPRYISIDHSFGGSGLSWARLSVRDKTNPADMDTATIEVQVLAVDTLNRKKNSAIDRGLRWTYLNEKMGADGSYWGNSYPVAETSMALIAFEQHKHNLEASDDDIYKRSVQEGLRWLFNHAYEVALSNQACIGDPEGVPGDPAYDDLDDDNDGYGIAFSGGIEGYEVGLAMLAIVNSCEKAKAQALTASSSSSAFVDGMTYWDIAVDTKDFLAYAQSEGTGGTGSYYCQEYPAADGHYRVLYAYESGANSFDFYFYGYIPTTYLCSDIQFKFVYGDGTEGMVVPGYCLDDSYGYTYFEVYGSHTYAGAGTYSANASYSIDNGVTWTDTCGFDVLVAGGGTECNPNGNGWRYSRNSGDQDNSVSQWPTLGLEEGRERWDININPKVIDTFKDWLAYSQGDTTGGFAYDYPGSWENFAKTGAGLAMLRWAGYSETDANVQSALNFLDSTWDLTCYDGNLGDFYAMYAFYKGMKYLDLVELNGRVWEDIYTQYLVDTQAGDGSWVDCHAWIPYPYMTTDMALAMLAPAPGGLPPVADAGGPYGPVNAGQDVMLDGSGSYHQDPEKNIVLYEWDFDATDGLWWDTKPSPAAGEGGVGETLTTSYPDTGSDEFYTVTLRVTDDSVPVQTDKDTATVTVTSGNVPPVALTDGPWAGLPGDTIVFDGSDSYDPNECTDPGNPSCLGDSIVSYEWDLDGDGIYNEGNGDDGTPVTPGDYSIVEKTYPEPISQTVTLRVTDSYGLTDTTSPQVNIVSIALVYAQEYDHCFRETLNRFEYRLGILVEFQNLGNGEAKNVVMTLTQTPTNLTILQDTSVLGNMGVGAVTVTGCVPAEMSADIELHLNRRIPPTGEWRWKAEFDIEVGGVLKHYIIDNLPPLAP